VLGRRRVAEGQIWRGHTTLEGRRVRTLCSFLASSSFARSMQPWVFWTAGLEAGTAYRVGTGTYCILTNMKARFYEFHSIALVGGYSPYAPLVLSAVLARSTRGFLPATWNPRVVTLELLPQSPGSPSWGSPWPKAAQRRQLGYIRTISRAHPKGASRRPKQDPVGKMSPLSVRCPPADCPSLLLPLITLTSGFRRRDNTHLRRMGIGLSISGGLESDSSGPSWSTRVAQRGPTSHVVVPPGPGRWPNSAAVAGRVRQPMQLLRSVTAVQPISLIDWWVGWLPWLLIFSVM
jgi:hypothetical protein